MALFKKDKRVGIEGEMPEVSASKQARRRKLKRGAYATAITCVFVAVVVVFNIVASALADRYPLSLDLTASGDYTINEKNAEYIKKVSRDDLKITITVCCDENEYDGEYAGNIISISGFYDPSGGAYFTQNKYLLKEYARLNKAITVQYIAPTDPKFSVFTGKYSDEKFEEGDIIVESSFTMNGETVERYRHFAVEDQFTVSVDQSDQYSYMLYQQYNTMSLTANNIETVLTSAIYSLTSDKVFQVALITHNCNSDSAASSVKNLRSLMEQNNYYFTEVSNLNEQDIPEDTDIVMIVPPAADYSESDMKKMEDYLNNGGKYDKHLFYIASAAQGDMPNINEFLSEWGFQVMSEDYVYETKSDNRANLLLKLSETDNKFTGSLDDKGYSFYSYLGYDVPIVQKDPNGQREYTDLLMFSDSAVALPVDKSFNDYTDADVEANGPFVGLGLCRTMLWDSDKEDYARSTVMVCSSLQIIGLGNSSARVGTLQAIMNTFDNLLGRSDADDVPSFDSRKFAKDQFETIPSDTAVNVMVAIFVVVLPVAVLITGIVVWIKRRRA